MDNQGNFNSELTRAAAHSCYKVSRNLTGPTKVPPTPSASFDSVKSTRRQAYTNVESVDMLLNAIAISPVGQQEHVAALKCCLSTSTEGMRTLLDYEGQHIVVTNTIKGAIVYTLLAILLLATGVGLGYASHLRADAILNVAAEVTPRWVNVQTPATGA